MPIPSAKVGYVFKGWTRSGSTVSGGDDRILSSDKGDLSFKAVFAEISSVTVYAVSADEGRLPSISGRSYSVTVNVGDIITLPNPADYFTGGAFWFVGYDMKQAGDTIDTSKYQSFFGDGSGSMHYSLKITADN